jgi:hypothetical protein
MSALDFAARLAGVPQATIDEVETALPHAAKLLQTFKDHEDMIIRGKVLIDEAMPLLVQVQAFYAKLAPLIAPAMAEIDAVMPATRDVLAFIQKQPDQTPPQTDQPYTGA